MEKLDMQTPNIADKNFEALSKMFPNAVTEAIGKCQTLRSSPLLAPLDQRRL